MTQMSQKNTLFSVLYSALQTDAQSWAVLKYIVFKYCI